MGYPLQGAIIRFVRVVAAATLLAVGLVLTHAATPEAALYGWQFAVGTALVTAADKLRREQGNVNALLRVSPQTHAIEPAPVAVAEPIKQTLPRKRPITPPLRE